MSRRQLRTPPRPVWSGPRRAWPARRRATCSSRAARRSRSPAGCPARTRSFQGDTRAAFNHYAGSDGQVDRLELSRLLEDAGIGSGFTRAFWVDGIMERVDQAPTGNGNGKISWPEFSRVISGGGGIG